MPVNYGKTYWNGNGEHERLMTKVTSLLPDYGEVNPGNPQLERFRIASNCYYDLYNNRLCNLASEFRKVFGFGASRKFDEGIVQKTEQKMNEILLAAAKEQGVVDFVEACQDALKNSI